MSGEGGAPLALLQDQQDGCFSSDYDNLASDAEIEAKALELKEKIFAECGMVSRRRKQMRNTRNPSKIWKWFTKTPDFIYCKVCGVGIKNSGNTTNASSHLKRHPRQYADFRMEATQQSFLGESSKEEVGREQPQLNFLAIKLFGSELFLIRRKGKRRSTSTSTLQRSSTGNQCKIHL